MGEEKKVSPRIEAALNLDGDPQRLQRFYREWAATYDQEVTRECYVAPMTVVEQIDRYKNLLCHDATDGTTQPVFMDAGCGTGKVGVLLKSRGLTQIDGFDLSPDMVHVAEATHAYRELRADINLNQPLEMYSPQSYDVAIASGVFTSGHVMPQALKHLAYLVRCGGLISVSTRVTYCEQSDYVSVSNMFCSAGLFREVEVLKGRPYTTDGNAHYWLYQVT